MPRSARGASRGANGQHRHIPAVQGFGIAASALGKHERDGKRRAPAFGMIQAGNLDDVTLLPAGNMPFSRCSGVQNAERHRAFREIPIDTQALL